LGWAQHGQVPVDRVHSVQRRLALFWTILGEIVADAPPHRVGEGDVAVEDRRCLEGRHRGERGRWVPFGEVEGDVVDAGLVEVDHEGEGQLDEFVQRRSAALDAGKLPVGVVV
jgi:hypothetical protein